MSKQVIEMAITVLFDEFPVTLSFSGSVDAIPQVIKRVRDLGGKPPSQPAAKTSSAAAAGDEPPADAPADVKEAWCKKVPFGKNKGQPLGVQSDKELAYLAKEARMDDIKAAAKKLVMYRLDAA